MPAAPLPSCASFLCKPARGCCPPRHQGVHGRPPGSSGLCRRLFPVYTGTSNVPLENSLVSFILFSLSCVRLEMAG